MISFLRRFTCDCVIPMINLIINVNISRFYVRVKNQNEL